MKFNPSKTETLLISRKQSAANVYPTLFFDQVPVKEVTKHKHLGIIVNNKCHWGDHIDYIVEKASSKLSILRKLKFDLDRETLKSMYFSFIRPILEYGDIIFDNCPEFCKSKLETN